MSVTRSDQERGKLTVVQGSPGSLLRRNWVQVFVAPFGFVVATSFEWDTKVELRLDFSLQALAVVLRHSIE